MMKHFITGVGFLFSLSANVMGQILPPDFVCVRNDTLFWEATPNTCGPFTSYLVFGSMEEEGPYVLLDDITDPGQTTFFNPNGPGQIWYYYLESNHDCPGLQAFASDTLDNRIPLVGPLNFVSVNGDGVEMQWTASESPEVFAYIIARNTTTGTQDIDTVFTGTSYTDFSADPQNQSETYFVTALDRCGNRSLVDDPHITTLANIANVDACERSISISWTAYTSWDNGVERYDILVSENGGPLAVVGTVNGSASAFTFVGVNDQSTYCFQVEAVENGTDFRARSSEACETVDVIGVLNGLRFNNASVNLDGTVDLAWQWNASAELVDASILQSTMGGTAVPIPDYVFSGSLNPTETATFSDPLANTGPVQFELQAVDNCGDAYTSNLVQTIFLRGNIATNQSTQLNWSAYQNDSAQVISYEVYQIRNGLSIFLDEVAGNELSYNVPFNPADPNQFSSCFFVVAQLELSGPGGTPLSLTSQSNVGCVEQAVELFVPNAFVPDGINRFFKPILQFGVPAEYSLKIWDRYGQLLFESNDIGTGWDGQQDGRPAPQGVYVYGIELTREGGEEIVKSGMVTLLR
ncbi:MAG: gliding motility-associated C-terminal domain-containing protein [Bacteroidota bacterium]